MTKTISRVTAAAGAALLLAPIMAFGGVVASMSAGATTPVRVLTCAGKPTTKPTAYVLSCADAGAGWDTMTWPVWSNSKAIGHGILRQNACVPDCVAGKFISYRTTVELSHVVDTTKYGDLFTRAVFHYSVNGKAATEVFDLAD